MSPGIVAAPGITEFVGDSGVGKTALVLHLCQNKKTLFLTSTVLTHIHVGEDVYIRRLRSLRALTAFIACSSLSLAKLCAFDCLVIDGLDTFFHTVAHPRAHATDIFRLTKTLRTLAFMHGITVLVTNDHSAGWTVDGCPIFSRYLGLRWCYVANTRYVLSRSNSGVREASKVFGDGPSLVRLRICDTGIVFVDDPVGYKA